MNGVESILDFDDLRISNSRCKISFVGRKKGIYPVTITVGNYSETIDVEVLSDDTMWLNYIKELTALMNSFPNSKDPVEGFKALGAWLVDNKPYNEGQRGDPKYLFIDDNGLDCIGYTGVFLDVAKRYYGFECREIMDESGHYGAEVVISGEKWRFDAGSKGKAGYREFTFINPSKEFGGVYNNSEGWWYSD